MIFLVAAISAGVIFVGSDPQAGEPLALSVETRAALTRDVQMKPAAEVGRLLGGKSSAPSTGSLGPKLDEAEQAFYSGKLDAAETSLAAIDDAIGKSGDIGPEMVRSAFLQGFIALKRGNAKSAADAFHRGLTVDPDARSDAFPPNVQIAIETERANLPARVTLKVVSPAGAFVTIDGRKLSQNAIAVLPGKHQLLVGGPTLRWSRRTIDVAGDTTLQAAAPAAVSPDLERALTAWDADASKKPPAEFSTAMSAAGLQALLIVQTRGTSARVVTVREGAVSASAWTPLDADGDSAMLAESAARSLIGTAIVIAAPTPAPTVIPQNPALTPPRTPRANPRGEKRSKTWLWIGVGALALAAAGGAAAAASGSKTVRDPDQTEGTNPNATTVGLFK